MIRHVYLIKLKDRSQAGIVAKKLRTLKEHVPEIYELDVGIDFKGADNSYDIVEYCTFKTKEDFEAFGVNTYHAGIREYLKTVQESTAKVDVVTEI